MTRKLLILLTFSLLAHSLFEDNPKIVTMSLKEQQDYFKETDFLVVSIVYDGKSDKSWQLSRTLLDLTDKLSNYVKFVSFDCSSEPGACAENILKDLPAVNFIIPNKHFTSSKNRVTEKPYVGVISSKEIGEAITREIPYLGEALEASDFSEFLNREGNKTVLFTNKEQVPLIFKGISSRFRDRIEVGIVFENCSSVIEEYQVTEYPTLIVFDDQQVVRFNGRHEFKDVAKFLQPYARLEKKVVEIDEEVDEVVQDEVEQTDLEGGQEVVSPKKFISVNYENFEQELKNNKKPALVHFHEDGESEDWEEIQRKLDGIVTLFDYNCENDKFCELKNIKNYPTLRLYTNLEKYVDFPANSLKAIESQISKDLKTEYSIITTKNLKDLINSVYHSGKVLCLLISKDSVPLSFKSLATNATLQQFVKFSYLNADEDSIKNFFELPRYPIILTIFHTDINKKPQTLDYAGNFDDYARLTEFIQTTTLKSFFRSRPNLPDEDLEDIFQVSEAQTWNSRCLKKKGYCLIGFLPEGGDKRLLKYVKAVMDQRKIYLNVFWTDGNCFKEFRDQLGVDEVPGLSLISPVNGRVWTFTGELTENKVFTFVEDALLGLTEGKNVASLEFLQGSCEQQGKKLKKHRIHKVEFDDL